MAKLVQSHAFEISYFLNYTWYQAEIWWIAASHWVLEVLQLICFWIEWGKNDVSLKSGFHSQEGSKNRSIWAENEVIMHFRHHIFSKPYIGSSWNLEVWFFSWSFTHPTTMGPFQNSCKRKQVFKICLLFTLRLASGVLLALYSCSTISCPKLAMFSSYSS